MIIKTIVSEQEKERIEQYAKARGQSVSAYVKERALMKRTKTNKQELLMGFIEEQASVSQHIKNIAIGVIENKAIYEEEVLELLDRMAELERITIDFLKGVNPNGNIGQQERKEDIISGSEV